MEDNISKNKVRFVIASLGIVFWLFIKIGLTAFGDFKVFICVVKNHVIERRGLLFYENMLAGISLVATLLGLIVFNTVAYVGYKLDDSARVLNTTVAVTLPSFLLILNFNNGNYTWDEMVSVKKFFFHSFILTVTAIFVSTFWNIGGKSLQGLSENVVAHVSFIGIGGFCLLLRLSRWIQGARSVPAIKSKNVVNICSLTYRFGENYI